MSSALQRRSPAPPVRIAHVGLGAFHRAHQAWYTDAAPDAGGWGIAAFTGRSRELADQLSAQGGLYHLLVRSNIDDDATLVRSIARATPGADVAAWCDLLAAPATAVLTATITEAGYRATASRALDVTAVDVAADLHALRVNELDRLRTAPGRIVAGLQARRQADGGPLAVVPCDNLPGNGAVAARVVGELAALVDPALHDWIDGQISFVSTVVDRITPATTDDIRAAVTALTGFDDQVPVVTEPFSEWVLAGAFPAGRPAWDGAGARFVDDVTPFELRKLRLLNGAHSLLAYAGTARGHVTVAQAIADDVCRQWVEQWWALASSTLTLPADDVSRYRGSLLERFGNARIAHRLEQIATDGSQKLAARVLPVVREAIAAGRDVTAAARILGAWVAHLRGSGEPLGVSVHDPRAAELADAAAGSYAEGVASVLRMLAPDIAADDNFVALVVATGREFEH